MSTPEPGRTHRHLSPVGKDPDQRDYIISNEKIEKTGFRTRHSLDDGTRELIRAYQVLRSSPHGNA